MSLKVHCQWTDHLKIRDSNEFIEIAQRVREGLRAGHGSE